MSERGGVVMVAGEGESTRMVFNRLQRAVGVQRVIIEAAVETKTFLKRRIAKLGLPTVAGQMLFKAAVAAPLRLSSGARLRAIKSQFELDESPIPEREVIRVPSINDPQVIEQLRALEPAVVVVNGTRIIAKRILEAIGAPFINMHAGITPLYRGVHGGYWALANGDREHCGVTVHLVDPGIDTGEIVGQALIAPTRADNFATYPLLQTAAGLPILVDAVKAVLDGNLQRIAPPAGASHLWSHPTLLQYLTFRLRNGTR